MKPLSLALAIGLVAGGCIKTDRERAVADGAAPLTERQASEAFTGNTLSGVISQYGIRFVVYYGPDGRITGAISGPVTDRARGKWRITDDGQVCNEWTKETWQTGPACNTYYKHGDEYKVFLPEGGVASVAQLKPGNAAKLELRTDFEVANAEGKLERVPVGFLRDELPGNTLSGKLNGLGNAGYHAFYAKDGRVSGSIPTASERDTGRYRITDEGEVCVKWSRWLDGEERCGPWFRDGESIRVFDAGGNLALSVTVREGDPEKLEI
ncbi:MAG: hypothetical protein AAGF92_03075 [Myxococcota bacterium]